MSREKISQKLCPLAVRGRYCFLALFGKASLDNYKTTIVLMRND